MRPLLVDLYCKAGGAGMGYHRAGFDVLGVDKEPQPRYPFPFIQADVLSLTPEWLRRNADAIHASPPCQAHTSLKTMHNAKKHEDLIPETRDLLDACGLPWIMENVMGAPMGGPAIVLCGTMFDLGVDDAELRRHRQFASNRPISPPCKCRHGQRNATLGLYGGHIRNRQRTITVVGYTPYNADARPGRSRTIGAYGEGFRDSGRKLDKGREDFSREQGQTAMGIDWMTNAEMSQAIPPAYTEHLGHQLMLWC